MADLHKHKQVGRLTDTQENFSGVEKDRLGIITFKDERHNATNNTGCVTGPLFATEEERNAISGSNGGK